MGQLGRQVPARREMGRLMARIIDVAKAQEAFDRAARNAVHGPRDVRAGRFVAGDASVSLPRGKLRLRRSPPTTGSHVAEKRGEADHK
jgi:hypothetical protein